MKNYKYVYENYLKKFYNNSFWTDICEVELIVITEVNSCIRYPRIIHFILSSSKELTSWVKLQVEIFCKASRRRALQKICTCSLTHDVSSLEDDNVFVFCLAFF